MQPQLLPVGPRLDGLVVGVLRSSEVGLRAALHTMAAAPQLLSETTRVVVLDRRPTGIPGSTDTGVLPPGLVRVLRRPGVDRATALAALLHAAEEEAGAASVLLLDDTAVVDAGALREALRCARESAASDVVGLTSSTARRPAPDTWWGALLPLEAVRAVGYTLPETGDLALADLVLRAEAAGYRPSVVRAFDAGPRREAPAAQPLLLALLHDPVGARTALLASGLADDLRALLAFRTDRVERRHAQLRALLDGPEVPLEVALQRRSPARRAALPGDSLRLAVRLWFAWPSLRRRARIGALDRASVEAWRSRFAAAEVDRGLPRGERATADRRPSAVRWRAWSMTRRGTSAA